METFHWDERFETGLQDVDGQHHHLVDVINRFGAQVTRPAGADWAELNEVFAEVTAYTRYHFGAEEALMRASGLDPVSVREHAEQHRHFIEDLGRMHAAATASDPASTARLFGFLAHWLVHHILGTDHSMAHQVTLIRGGADPAEARRQRWSGAKRETSGLLLESLQGLLQIITFRNRELVALNANLEAKVAERTEELSEANRRLEHLALTDPLTGLPNRRHAFSRLEILWGEAAREGTVLTAMMIDADGFKAVNDTYGHDAGDALLRSLARSLREAVRTDDVVCRLGGDEFLILCARTPLVDALRVAEALRQGIAALRVPTGAGTWQGSVSVGVAESLGLDTPESLIIAADAGVYVAKREGRNRVATVQRSVPLPGRGEQEGSSTGGTGRPRPSEPVRPQA